MYCLLLSVFPVMKYFSHGIPHRAIPVKIYCSISLVVLNRLHAYAFGSAVFHLISNES